jgi:ketosteroid isomerase-like protein
LNDTNSNLNNEAAMNQRDLIPSLYAAFADLDPEGMKRSYAEDATFDDPAFSLRGRDEIVGMWSMLCDAVRANGRDVWQLRLVEYRSDESTGHARWEARYRFSATGRIVHNRIDAQFELRDGLIWRHRDEFNFHRWARQALGPIGWLLGATPWLEQKVRTQAASNLARYLAKAASR